MIYKLKESMEAKLMDMDRQSITTESNAHLKDSRNNTKKPPKLDSPNQHKPVSFLGVLQSVFAAAFGVQSQKKRLQDFSQGKPFHYVLVGILFTAVFILVMVGLVQVALKAL